MFAITSALSFRHWLQIRRREFGTVWWHILQSLDMCLRLTTLLLNDAEHDLLQKTSLDLDLVNWLFRRTTGFPQFPHEVDTGGFPAVPAQWREQ